MACSRPLFQFLARCRPIFKTINKKRKKKERKKKRKERKKGKRRRRRSSGSFIFQFEAQVSVR
jgi:hypothetical protein